MEPHPSDGNLNGQFLRELHLGLLPWPCHSDSPAETHTHTCTRAQGTGKHLVRECRVCDLQTPNKRNSNSLATWCEELTHLKRPDVGTD